MLGLGVSRRWLLLNFQFFLFVGVLGCSRSSAEERPLAAPVESLRIVSLHDVTSEILVELGLVGSLVGVEALVDPLASLSLALRGTPRVSSLESIVAVYPTHVVGLKVTGRREPELVKRLRALGAKVVLEDPTSLKKSHGMLTALGQLFHRESQARRLGRAYQRELGRSPLAKRSEVKERRPQVFVYDCCEPAFTAGGRGLLNELIERAGGRNLFADLQADWGSVSWEEVVSRRPDLIVVHAYDYEGQKDVASKRSTLHAIPGLKDIPTAVLPLGCSLGGLRSLEGLSRLRMAIAGLKQ